MLREKSPLPIHKMPDALAGVSASRPLTSFVGRGPEIAAILELLLDDEVRLVTLTGPGGVGKTRIAWQVFDAMREAGYEAWFLSMAAIRDPELVPAAIADSVGNTSSVRLGAKPATLDTLRFRKGLLVLDNFEQILPAASQLPGLLAATPTLTLLVTSRAPLHLSAERLFMVGPLGGGVDHTDTVALFADRARAQVASFTLDHRTIGDVQRICERLGGLPLAIELAAARIAVLSPSELLTRLDRALAILTGGPRDAPVRHQTMRATIAWSHDLLAPEEQVMLRRLGVFVDGCTLDAATAVAGLFEDEALDRISALVRASLLTPSHSPDGQTRYHMLETVRSFALERLAEAGEDDLTHLAHARYFVTLAEDALPGYDGPDLRQITRRMQADLANSRAAVAWCLSAGEREIAVRLAGALWHVWLASPLEKGVTWLDNISEGYRVIEQVLRDRDALPLAAVTEAFNGAARFALTMGNTDRVEELARELLARAGEERDRYAQYWALVWLAGAAFQRDQLDTARRMNRGMLAIAPAIRDTNNQAASPLINIAYVDLHAGNATSAKRYAELGLARARACGNPCFILSGLNALGLAHYELNELREAFAYLAEAYQLARDDDERMAVLDLRVHLATIALRCNQPAHAAVLLSVDTAQMNGHTRQKYDAAVTTLRRQTGRRIVIDPERGPGIAQDDPAVMTAIEAIRSSFDDAPANGTRDGPGALSPRETDVLRLLAGGHSNRSIAGSLSISERTVESHVLHILSKLGLRSRTEAATWAVRNGVAE